jgi:hypothetical protein
MALSAELELGAELAHADACLLLSEEALGRAVALTDFEGQLALAEAAKKIAEARAHLLSLVKR